MVEQEKDFLLNAFVKNDETVQLINEKKDFCVELSLTAAKVLTNIMKLENGISKVNDKVKTSTTVLNQFSGLNIQNETENNKKHSVDVGDVKKASLVEFVSYLHGNEILKSELKWEQCVPLIKLCYKFDVTLLLDILLPIAKLLIKNDNVFEAVEIIELFSIDWMDECSIVVQSNTHILNGEKCEIAIAKYPTSMANLLRRTVVLQQQKYASLESDEDEYEDSPYVDHVPQTFTFKKSDNTTNSELFNSFISTDAGNDWFRGPAITPLSVKSIKQTLLDAFCEQDKKITLVDRDNDVQVQLSITAASHFSPIIAEYVGASLDNSSLSFSVSCVSRNLLDKLVSCIIEDRKVFDLPVESESFLAIMKLSKELRIDCLYIECIQKGQFRINKNNIFEFLRVMDVYGIDEWLNACIGITRWNQHIMEGAVWENLVKENPKVMSKFLMLYVRTVNNYRFEDFGALATQKYWYGYVLKQRDLENMDFHRVLQEYILFSDS